MVHLAVGFDGVHVHFAAKVFDGDQRWAACARRRLRFRRNSSRSSGGMHVKLELAVDFVFGGAGDALVVVQAKQAVFVEGEAHLQRALAQRDVVVLGAGEVLHGRAVGFRRQQADVHLHAAAQLEADLVVAFGQHVGDAGEAQDLLDELRRAAHRPRSICR